MATSDKLLGSLMLFTAAFVFIYYTTWALFLPFLPPTSPLTSLFPPRTYLTLIPIFLLLTALSGVGLFFARVMLAEGRKRGRAGKKV